MIAINLDEPQALETLSALHLESARALDASHRCIVACAPASAKIHADRAARINAIAESVQRAIIQKRSRQTVNVHAPQSPSD